MVYHFLPYLSYPTYPYLLTAIFFLDEMQKKNGGTSGYEMQQVQRLKTAVNETVQSRCGAVWLIFSHTPLSFFEYQALSRSLLLTCLSLPHSCLQMELGQIWPHLKLHYIPQVHTGQKSNTENIAFRNNRSEGTVVAQQDRYLECVHSPSSSLFVPKGNSCLIIQWLLKVSTHKGYNRRTQQEKYTLFSTEDIKIEIVLRTDYPHFLLLNIYHT